MTKTTRFAIFLALLLGLYLPQLRNHNVYAQNQSVVAPVFALNLLDGGSLQTSELKGKIQVLKFVASY